MNLVKGQPLGDPVTLYMQKPGDCAVFPGRWVYHRSIHTNTVGIRGVLHKVRAPRHPTGALWPFEDRVTSGPRTSTAALCGSAWW